MYLKENGGGPDLAVLAHPLRLRIVEVCTELGALSPGQIRDQGLCDDIASLQGKDKEQRLSTIAWHCRRLADAELLTRRTERARGRTKNIYSANTEGFFDDDEWGSLDRERREALSAVVWRRLLAAVHIAMEAGVFDSRLNRMLSFAPLVLDEQGWTEAAKLMANTFRELEGIRTGSEARLTVPGAIAIPATYGLLLFESPLPRSVSRS